MTAQRHPDVRGLNSTGRRGPGVQLSGSADQLIMSSSGPWTRGAADRGDQRSEFRTWLMLSEAVFAACRGSWPVRTAVM